MAETLSDLMTTPLPDAIRRMRAEWLAELEGATAGRLAGGRRGGTTVDGILMEGVLEDYMAREQRLYADGGRGHRRPPWLDVARRITAGMTARQLRLFAYHVVRAVPWPADYVAYAQGGWTHRAATLGESLDAAGRGQLYAHLAAIAHGALADSTTPMRRRGLELTRWECESMVRPLEGEWPRHRIGLAEPYSPGQFERVTHNLACSLLARAAQNSAAAAAVGAAAAACFAVDALSRRPWHFTAPRDSVPIPQGGADAEGLDALFAAALADVAGGGVRATPDPAVLAWNDGCVGRLAEACRREAQGGEGHPCDFLDKRCFVPGYGGRESYHRLPLLADALEEAGCADAELLAHLRLPPAAHMLGCWALDHLTQQGRKVRR